MIFCFVASAVRCVCRFLLSVRCGGGVVVFMLCLFIGYVVCLWAHWLVGCLAGYLAGYPSGWLAGWFGVCLRACAGPLGDY